MKRLGLLLLICCLPLLTGCRAALNLLDQEAVRLPEEGQEALLRVSWWGSEARHEAMRRAIELYEGARPGVSVRMEYGGADGWLQRLRTQLQNGDEPDVMLVEYSWVHSLGRGGNVFYDLRQLARFIDLDLFDQDLLRAMEVNGQLAAAPYGITARMNLYSLPFFEAHRIAYPRSFAALIDAGLALQVGQAQADGAQRQYIFTAIGKDTVDDLLYQMLMLRTGRSMVVGSQVDYTPQEVAAALLSLRAMEEAGVLAPFAEEDPIQNEQNPAWAGGRSGGVRPWLHEVGLFSATYLGGAAPEELLIMPFSITEDQGSGIFVKPTAGFAVSRGTEQPALAADFINFLFTNEEAIRALGDTFGLSSHRGTLAVQRRDSLVTGLMGQGYAQLDGLQPILLSPFFEEANVRGARYRAIEGFRTGALTADEAARQYIDQQDAALARLQGE